MNGVIANQAPSLPLAELLGHTADAVHQVRSGQSLTDVLAALPARLRPGVQALSFHVLRWLGSATELRALLAPKTPPVAVDALLVCALALLWPGGQPPPYAEHTLVDQAVTAARQRVPAAAAFINAVLRRFLREREALVAAVNRSVLGAYNHPAWWVDRVRRDWPDAGADATGGAAPKPGWQTLLANANQRPPMTLRINRRRCTGSQYVQRLADAGRGARLQDSSQTGIAGVSHTVVLDQPCPVQQLPGFAEGDFSVQDRAAQRAAPLLLQGLKPGARVLDACAAPGGKTAHLLEWADLDLLALDSDATRLARVSEGLLRLGLLPPTNPSTALEASSGSRVAVRVGDARQPQGWWDGRPFDAILLDAPCTASGIVRRHPDVRWLRRASDVATLARTQAELLHALWPLVAPGGRLLYATCSIFRAEGEQQIDAFLQRLPQGQAHLDPASPGHLLGNPDNAAMLQGHNPAETPDGFFYALIHKTHPPTL
jgi:16S rRNA (cytosine967-C5)-methyltransferase